MTQKNLLAAVDMGSSSFRMIVARVEELDGRSQIYVIDSLREPVRLGAGLSQSNHLEDAAQEKALAALVRFNERLRGFGPDQVRAVATNAVRVARNGVEFINKAEKALGFPIDIVTGIEEARLVYCGAAHQLPTGQGKRLVVDIGGGSTEFIIGEDYEPIAMESLYMGAVSAAQTYFPTGQVTAKSMKQAILAARKEITVVRRQLTELGWTHVIGSSGTSRALADICVANGYTDHGISSQALETIKQHVIEAGSLDKITLLGLKADRLPMMPGGLAVMCAVFEELEIKHMEVTEGALRQGLLYDMLGRQHHHDMRELTVQQFTKRYGVDMQHALRVKALAQHFYDQLNKNQVGSEAPGLLLGWACELHETGLAIAHNGYHKHSAYILDNADMPGFAKREQSVLAFLVLSHNGKLAKLAPQINTSAFWQEAMCLRLAVLFLRRRQADQIPDIKVKSLERGMRLSIPAAWLKEHPLTQYNLEIEQDQWQKAGLTLQIA